MLSCLRLNPDDLKKYPLDPTLRRAQIEQEELEQEELQKEEAASLQAKEKLEERVRRFSRKFIF